VILGWTDQRCLFSLSNFADPPEHEAAVFLTHSAGAPSFAWPRISNFAALDKAAGAAFVKECRMKLVDPTDLDRKSGLGEGSDTTNLDANRPSDFLLRGSGWSYLAGNPSIPLVFRDMRYHRG
jgi:hypothetical protein